MEIKKNIRNIIVLVMKNENLDPIYKAFFAKYMMYLNDCLINGKESVKWLNTNSSNLNNLFLWSTASTSLSCSHSYAIDIMDYIYRICYLDREYNFMYCSKEVADAIVNRYLKQE